LPATLAADGDRQPGTYVHAKVAIVDDEWLTIGSANLNAHSLFNDTEANLVFTDADLVRGTRLRLWAEHLGTEDVDGDPARLFDEQWVRIRRGAARSPPRPASADPTDCASSKGCPLGATSYSGNSFGLLVDG